MVFSQQSYKTDAVDTMDLIEVDTESFMKCRLCLKDKGVYRIVPIVRQQIKFCFDIDVNLFDGLSQLICKKCKSILTEFFAVKINFIENQNSLKIKIEVKNETATESCDQPIETVSSSQNELEERIEHKRAKKRTYLVSSSTSSVDVDFKESSSSILDKKKHNTSSTKRTPSAWEAFYLKKIVCVMCQKRFRKKSSLVRHFKKHDFVSRYHDIFKTYCKVNMNKIDDQPNMTGDLSTVVYRPDKIISNECKANYYVLYTPKNTSDSTTNDTPGGCGNGRESVDNSTYLDSSDDCMFVKRQPKRRRLSSSNETVVLEGEKNEVPITFDNEEKFRGTVFREAEPNNTECINIDDSSDNESCKSNKTADKPVRTFSSLELKNIENIVSNSYSKYLNKKKSESCLPRINTGNTESQLKHKILNMGRKVITKQGFNCTGLLRFVENKILEVLWTPSTSGNGNKESNYVYIMPKLRGKEQYLTDNLGWKFIPGTHENYSEQAKTEAPANNIPVDQMNSIKDTVNTKSPVLSSSGPLNGHLNANKSLVVGHINKKQTLVVQAVEQAVLYTMNADTDTSIKNKLLNANPVANPKQLPKKSTVTDSKLNGKSDAQNNEIYIYLDKEGHSDKTSCMPIITSTTSLASSLGSAKEERDNNNKDVTSNNVTIDSEKSTPRLKLKPVSELMSERVLKNLQQQVIAPSNMYGLNQDANVTLPNQNTVSHLSATKVALPSQGNGTPPLKTLEIVPSSSIVSKAQVEPVLLEPDREYVILDTVEMPNSKTNSPFRYFKNLLMFHNIDLLEPHETVTPEFACLIKFKLQYKQDNVDQPVVLFMSILCAYNRFYLGVKYSGQENNIDLNKLPANWQWEILNKIYQDEVMNKVLKNAQKINSTVYAYTNSFLCLLKSIKFKRDT